MRRILSRAAMWVVVVQIVLIALLAGWRARQHVWYQTEPVRYRGDIRNAFRHGWNVIELARQQRSLGPELLPSWRETFVAYLSFYDRVREGWPEPGYHLDYPPMRLFVMTTWTRWLVGQGNKYDPSDLRAWLPLMWFNTIIAFLGAVAAFLLVRHWLRRSMPPDSNRPMFAGLLAGALLWLDPAILVDAHAWPQWDVWLVPFYLFAMYAASTRRWLTAGLIFSVGIMFKGQLLAATPVLLLWPIFSGQWRGLYRLLVGCVAGLAIIQSMWIFSRPLTATLICLVIAVVIALRVWQARFLRGHHASLIAICSSAVFGLAWAFNFSFAWITQGFIYGAERNVGRMASRGVNNLAALLTEHFRWGSSGEIVTRFTLFGEVYSPTIGQLMTSLYGLGLVACAIALAVHARRNDARALAAIAAPWVLFYALMPQLSSRYFVWGAAVTSLLAGLGAGPVLLHLLISICSATTILHVLIVYSDNWKWWPEAARVLNGANPGSGWLTLMLATVTLYLALSRTPRRDHHVIPT